MIKDDVENDEDNEKDETDRHELLLPLSPDEREPASGKRHGEPRAIAMRAAADLQRQAHDHLRTKPSSRARAALSRVSVRRCPASSRS